MNKLITLLLISVMGVFIIGTSQAIPYADYTTLFRKAETTAYGGSSVGWVISTTKATGVAKDIFLYEIKLNSCNTTDNIFTVYDAVSYADATGNNRPILAKATYEAGTTWVQYNGSAPGMTATTGLTSGIGIMYLGDVGAVWKFTNIDGKPIKLQRGIVIKSTNGLNIFTATVIYFKD